MFGSIYVYCLVEVIVTDLNVLMVFASTLSMKDIFYEELLSKVILISIRQHNPPFKNGNFQSKASLIP